MCGCPAWTELRSWINKQIAPDIRVVIFTGYGSKDVAVEALRGRADDYLEKAD